MNRKIMRGEIYYADLSPVVGSEQGGLRPVLILQNNIGNKHSPTVVVAPITSRLGKSKLPTHVRLGLAHLMKDSIVLLEQISMVREDLIRETAKILGYTRLGGNVTAAMEAGLAHAEQMGSIALNPGGMYLLTESGTDRANQIIETFCA